MQQIRRWNSFADVDVLQHTVVKRIVACAAAAIEAHGAFRIVLAGGRTPEAIYSQLRAITTNWRTWSIFFGDERCLPDGDKDRNDSMARAAWLDAVPIPRAQIYSIPAQLGPIIGAEQYSAVLDDVGEFDLVLLGLGEDGHTASLFPGDTDALQAISAAVPIINAPKPPPERISMSAARLSNAQQVLFLVVGAEKSTALLRWRNNEAIPASFIKPAGGVDIYTDIMLS